MKTGEMKLRKLVSICNVDAITRIEGADFIECVHIKGWSVVCQKGIHNIGDSVLYFELDSFLPESDKRFESFMKFGTRTFNGVVGHRVKTVRLKGVYSQGVIMPISEFPEIDDDADREQDYAEYLGIVKWEAPEVSQSAGKFGDAKGNFPWFLRKSDQERIQNLYGKLSNTHHNTEFVGTLKMDGSSITVFYVDGDRYENKGVGLCSRNLELKYDPDLPFEEQGCFIKGAINSDLFNKAKELHEKYGSYYAIQGELVGAGIQKTFEKFEEYQVFAYNIFDIVKGEFVTYCQFEEMCFYLGIQTVPVIYQSQHILREDLKTILDMATGEGLRAPYREGIVWKEVNGTCQFKVISNKYLEKEKD